MKQEHSHEEELNLDALLAKSSAKPGFEVPEGYFEQFPDRLKERLKAEEGEDEPDPELGLPREEVFEVPQNYFGQLSTSLNARLQAEAGSEEAPSLSHLPKSEVFQVPEGYFEASAARLSQIPAEEGKVISMTPPAWQKPLAWMLAAAVAFICLMIAWPDQASQTFEEPELAALSELDEQALFAAIDWQDVAVEDIVALVPEEKLDDLSFIEEVDLTDEELDSFLEEMDTEDLEDLVEDWELETMN